MIEIRVARTAAEREAIHRFRYEVFVGQMGRNCFYADHGRRRIAEPLDHTGALIGAWDGDVLIGTLRINHAEHGGLGDYEQLYQLHRLGHYYPHGVAICTKFMVEPSRRGSAVSFRLARFAHAYCTRHGLRYALIDTNPQLKAYYQRLGFRPFFDVQHPAYGALAVMIMTVQATPAPGRVPSGTGRLRSGTGRVPLGTVRQALADPAAAHGTTRRIRRPVAAA